MLRQYAKKYRPEIIASIIIFVLCIPLLQFGDITFSDLAFGRQADQYLHYVMGVFNEQFGTPNWFNLPRLVWILPSYIVAMLFGNSGHILVFSLIYSILLVACWSLGHLYRMLMEKDDHPISEIGLIGCILLYTFNPWVLIRIQHIYLLCGYALVPLALALTWRALGDWSWKDSNFAIFPSFKEIQRMLLIGLVVSASFAGIHFGIFIILCLIAMGITLATIGLHGIWSSPSAWYAKILRWFTWYTIRAVGIGSGFLLFSLYWVLPFVWSILGGVRPSQNNINAIETVVNFSRASSPQNVLLGISYWWPMFAHESLSIAFWLGGFIILFVSALGVWKSKRWLLFAINIPIFVLATGTYFSALAPKYISLVFDSMYPFGDMIRDPNKLYGVLVLSISLFFAYGYQYIEEYVEKNPIRFQDKHPIPWIISLAFMCWQWPVYHVFMLGYYAPIEWPAVYDRLHTELEKLPSTAKVLYLPVSDFATDPNTRVATPSFNHTTIGKKDIAKATADHMVFDTRKDTVFPFEGNDMMVMALLQFLHNQMDKNSISGVGGLVSKLGVTHVVLRTDYPYLQEELNQYKDILSTQQDMTKIWEDEFISLYSVENSDGQAQLFENLTYTTGGLERLLWLPQYFQSNTKDINIIFGYDGHNASLSHLQSSEVVDITTWEDIVVSQLEISRFAFPADSLRTVNPETNWAKLIVSSHDWQRISSINHIETHAYDFDMGHGVAFTTSPYLIPHSAFVSPHNGIPMVNAQMEHPETFLLPYESFQIFASSAQKHTPKTNKFSLIVKADRPEGEWQFIQSQPVVVEENALYHISTIIEDIEISNIEYRVGFYSKDGNRLGTAIAEPENTINSSDATVLGKTFLTPMGTTTAKIEFRVLYNSTLDSDITVRNLQLYDLRNFATPNTIAMTLPPQESVDSSIQQEGELWIRYLSSKNGGELHIVGDGVDSKINTTSARTAKFIWAKIPTTTVPTNISITNKHGVNAVNAITWLSSTELDEKTRLLEEQLADKTLMHIIDSVHLSPSGTQSISAVESRVSSPELIGGTMLYGLQATVASSFPIIKDGNYSIDIHDLIRYNFDQYTIHIYKNGDEKPILSIPIQKTSPQRTTSDSNIGNTHIPPLHLEKGDYTIAIQLQSSQVPIASWDALDFKDIPTYSTQDETTHTVTRHIQNTETAWASIFTEEMDIIPENPLLLHFEYATKNSKDFHGKIQYLDENSQHISIVYLDQTMFANDNFLVYEHFDVPPPNARKARIQFLAQKNTEEITESYFSVRNLVLWAEKQSIGIDSVTIIEENTLDWADEYKQMSIQTDVARGKRRLTVPAEASLDALRMQFFEAPIAHWSFWKDGMELQPYAINGVSFALDIPSQKTERTQTIYASVPLNASWKKGILVLVFGIGCIILLEILAEMQRQRTIRKQP